MAVKTKVTRSLEPLVLLRVHWVAMVPLVADPHPDFASPVRDTVAWRLPAGCPPPLRTPLLTVTTVSFAG